MLEKSSFITLLTNARYAAEQKAEKKRVGCEERNNKTKTNKKEANKRTHTQKNLQKQVAHEDVATVHM